MELRLEVDAASLYHAFARAPEATRRHLRIAVKESAEEVKEQAQKVHKFTSRTGGLENSVTTGFHEPMTGVVSLGPEIGPKQPYLAAIHNGSKPHPIFPKNANLTTQRSLAGKFGVPKGSRLVLRFPIGGGFAFARFVNHPGTKPDPFLFDALRVKEGRIQFIMTESVKSALHEAGLA